MKLRNKLFYRIFIVLFLQVILIAGFSLFNFYQQTRKVSRQDLSTSFRDARFSLEMLKNRLMHNIHFLRFYFRDKNIIGYNTAQLTRNIYEYFTSIQADWIFILDKHNRFIVDVKNNAERVSGIVHLIDHYHFRFPKNEFIISTDLQGVISLFLVTGTTIFQDNAMEYHIYIINRIDKQLIDSLKKETGINVGFFTGTQYICSDLIHFSLPAQGKKREFSLTVSSVPYIALNQIISMDFPNGLNLVVLKSTIGDRLYIIRIVYIYIITFLVTLIISFIIVAWLTGVLLSPLYRLKKWLETYMLNDRIEPLTIYMKDEIGFITSTFHTMVTKLIEEERIIKEQLKQISFLHQYSDTIVKNLQAGIMVCNKKAEIEYVNPYFCTLISQPEDAILHQNINDIISSHFKLHEPETRFSGVNVRKPGTISSVQYVQANGEVLRFIIRIIPITIMDDEVKTLLVLEDVTKTERLWHKILVAEKIASLGLLSAGMAHEINNPLGSILSHVNYLTAVEDNQEKLDSLKWIESETKRITSIIERVLSFARADDRGEVADINRIISETVNLMKIDFGQKQIQIITNLTAHRSIVPINTNEFRQVMLNLLLNADHAIEKNGRIEIETNTNNNHVCIILKDNGHGIKEEELPHIFDPFFTTKQAKGGTGLGLSITYNIIRRVGGNIHIESEYLKGTTVTVMLPCEGEKQ